MSVVFALASALAYGLSDFVAGLLSRRLRFVQVAVVGHLAGFGITVGALPFVAGIGATASVLGWGALAGLGSTGGTLALYRGLGRGPMGVVAPLSALGAAVFPALVGVGLGERPSIVVWAGIAVALPAIVLVSGAGTPARPPAHAPVVAVSPAPHGRSGRPEPRGQPPASILVSPQRWSSTRSRPTVGVGDGLLAGVGFAVLFVGLDLAGGASGLWPVVTGQAVSLVILAAVAAITTGRATFALSLRDVGGAATVGLLAAAATVLYLVAAQLGLLTVTAVLTALYPAATIALAALVLGERIVRWQGVGLLLAAIAVGLVVAG